jgi:hypothetical protein
MDRPANEPNQDEIENLQRSENEVALEDLDLPADLKAELLRELDGFKEGGDAQLRGERPPRRA